MKAKKNNETKDLIKEMLLFLFSNQHVVTRGRAKRPKYIYYRTSKAHMLIYARVMKRLDISYTYKKVSDHVAPRRMKNWSDSYGGVYVISCDISKNL